MTILTTPRLRLEPITDAHFEGLHTLNLDPEVMRYITGKPDTPEDTQMMIDRVKARWAEWGYSWWAFIEIRDDGSRGELIGAGCIQHMGRDRALPHEIGWRLRRDRWGRGLASEAAQEMARFAFEDLQAPELQAVCMPDNAPSAKVMLRLGMHSQGLGQWYDMEMAVYGMSRADWLALHPPGTPSA